MSDAEHPPASDDERPHAEHATAADLSGLARIGATALLRALGWAARTSVDSGSKFVKDVQSGEALGHLVDARVEAARDTAFRALGLRDGAHGRMPDLAGGETSYSDLRAAGDHLLHLSLDSRNQPRDEHPAFARILQEIVPDEARILRFMALAGPQPSIDIRTRTPFGVGSERVAGGINFVADLAGCTYPDRNQQYLANLARLGLVRFSADQIPDPTRYSFLEAQPATTAALAQARRTRTVYRSIYLSLFGREFCEVCFTLDDGYNAGGWIEASQ